MAKREDWEYLKSINKSEGLLSKIPLIVLDNNTSIDDVISNEVHRLQGLVAEFTMFDADVGYPKNVTSEIFHRTSRR